MTAADIISKFDTYTDDMSELSAADKLDLLNKKYRELSNEREWEWLRSIGSVAIASSIITLPTDFKILAEDFTAKEQGIYSGFRFFFWIGDIAYPVVSIKERRTYGDHAYFDPKNRRIVLQDTNVTGTAEFDYYGKVTALGLNDEPAFSDDYHPVLYHMMAIDHEIIDQSEKARSMRPEHEAAIEGFMQDLTYEDSQSQEDFVE